MRKFIKINPKETEYSKSAQRAYNAPFTFIENAIKEAKELKKELDEVIARTNEILLYRRY
jgi:hypothetical protein